MKFRKVIESGIITAALALTSVTTAVSASAAETGTTTESSYSKCKCGRPCKPGGKHRSSVCSDHTTERTGSGRSC